MFFTRTHTYHFPVSRQELKNRLVGRHVKIHDLDFEVLEKEGKLSIVPHAEQVNAIKTLPITSVVFNEESNGKTKVVITSKMRQLDSGGPYLILIFCAFLLIAAGILLNVGNEPGITYTLLGAGISIFTIFWVRMEMGYFDYVRKVRAYVKEKANPSFSEANMSVA